MEVDSITAFTRGHDVEDIYVKKSWRPKKGQPVPQMDGYFVGKKFGAGALSMNSIYDLVDEQGNSLGQALKVCKQSMSARRSLAHEWKMFKDLRVLGEDHAAVRSHFLQAHRVMKLSNNTIVGIVMEKANGQNVSKTLRDPNFCNVRYVIALLRDLLVALDVAQRVLGFVHYDLKLDNVMEHWSCNTDPDTSKARVMVDGVPQFKLFDFGTAVIYPDPFALRRVPNKHNTEMQPPTAAEDLTREKHEGDSDKPGVITHSATAEEFEYSEPFSCVRVYHMYWEKRGDVFRVMLALCKLLDDRVWPLEDLELVSLLFTVLEHATNSRRLKARFMPRAGLVKKLGLHDKPASPKQQQCGRTQQQQEKMVKTDLSPAGLEAHRYQAPSAAAAAGGSSPMRLAAADGQKPPRVSVEQRLMMNTAAGGAGNAVASMVNGGSTVTGGSTAGMAPAAGLERQQSPILPRTLSPTGRPSEDVTGVAYTRLAPMSSSTPAVAPPSAVDAFAANGGAVAHRGGEGATGQQQYRQTNAAGQGCQSQEGRPQFDVNAADEGCMVDPAAAVIAAQPIAPTEFQSVLGSRKALKGVTAKQLLAEPIIQSLLSKV